MHQARQKRLAATVGVGFEAACLAVFIGLEVVLPKDPSHFLFFQESGCWSSTGPAASGGKRQRHEGFDIPSRPDIVEATRYYAREGP